MSLAHLSGMVEASAIATTAAVKATGARPSSLSSLLACGSLQSAQLDLLQSLVNKHLVDPGLTGIATTEDFSVTSIERGIPRYEHPHLVAALDILLMYQASRRAVSSCGCTRTRSYRHDPRTRFVELMKRWLRANAVNASVGEEEVRRVCGLVRDLMNYPQVFPPRNPRSFMHTLAEVYDHLKLQLREVLQRDRTCAELAARSLILSRNLISDAIAYLLLAATDLKQTDELPSLEVVSLWQTLPKEANPLPKRADHAQQILMREAWLTLCGSLVASLLSMPWSFRLFDGKGAEEEAAMASLALQDRSPGSKAAKDRSPKAIEDRPSPGGPTPDEPSRQAGDLLALLVQVRAKFDKGQFSSSGLAGAFREPGQNQGRHHYLAAIEALFDLIYLLGEVFVQFHRISDGLGDYGMIRVAPWLHPFLEAVVEKVQRLRGSLEGLHEAVDTELVIAKAKGYKVKKPAPTEYMSARAHAAIDRAIISRDCHANLLLQTFEELKARSAPERLPQVVEGLSDACKSLQNVLSSQQFRARVSGAFPQVKALDSAPASPTGANFGALVPIHV